MPLYSNKKIIGFLFLARRDTVTESFDFDTVALLSLIGNNISLILDKIKLFQETRRLAITDSLTGLFNRRHFYKHLAIEIARSKRYGNTFSVMLFDIDNFKQINDTYGHHAGDMALIKISDIFKAVKLMSLFVSEERSSLLSCPIPRRMRLMRLPTELSRRYKKQTSRYLPGKEYA
jgi:GAF domain-containing protein